jgi:hypothetical protein
MCRATVAVSLPFALAEIIMRKYRGMLLLGEPETYFSCCPVAPQDETHAACVGV